MSNIELVTLIDAPRRVVFDLSRSIDLHKISTKHTDEEAIDGKIKGLIGLDEYVTWRAKHLGVYQKLTSKITKFDIPNSFTDEMIEGAFKKMTHDHLFYDQEGKTRMVDVFYFEVPFGWFGTMVDKLLLRNYMKRLLIKRNEIVKQYAESGRWKEVLSIS